MAIIHLTDEQYYLLMDRIPTYKGGEAKLYAFKDENNHYKLFKMFLFTFEEERINKENTVLKIYKEKAFTKIEIYDLVYYHGNFLGYIMNLKLNSRKLFQCSNESEQTKLQLLKLAKKELVKYHEKGIIYGDIKGNNILVNRSMDDVCLGDIDNVFIGDYQPELIRSEIHSYLKDVGSVDFKLDAYMFNLFTMNFLNLNSKELVCDQSQIHKIQDEMLHLNSDYSGEYLIDYIKKK